MYTDDQIDDLIQPVIDRQESINMDVIQTISSRINKIGTVKPEDINRLQLIAQTSVDIREINKMIAQQTNLQVKQIKSIIKDVALDSYIDAKPFYDYRHKTFIPFKENKELRSISDAIARETGNTYKNISNTRAMGFLVDTPKHPGKLVFKSVKETYINTIDKAIQAVQTGLSTKDAAINNAIAQLTKSGLRRVYWESGYTKRLDAAVRQAIHDGLKALQLQLQREIAKQIGADGWQLSAHRDCAPDHEPIQGHAFTLEEFDKMQNNEPFEDTWGNSFSGLERIIGQWNCRHWAWAVILGKYNLQYKPETLERWKKENAKGYTLSNGKHLTRYECSQYMRKLESKIRDAKEQKMAMEKLGNTEAIEKAKSLVSKWTKLYKTFCKQSGMAIQKNKIAVPDYR